MLMSVVDLVVSLMEFLEEIWLDRIYVAQREYNKSRCLYPNTGDDWRRII